MVFDIQSLDGGALEFQASDGAEVATIALRSVDFTQIEDGLFVVRDAVSAPSRHGGTPTKALLKDKDGEVLRISSVGGVRDRDANIRLFVMGFEPGDIIKMNELVFNTTDEDKVIPYELEGA